MLYIVFALINFRAVSLLHAKNISVSSGKDTASHTFKKKERKTLAMNVTESNVGSLVIMCSINKMVWKQEDQVEKIAFAMTAIIVNVISLPSPSCTMKTGFVKFQEE